MRCRAFLPPGVELNFVCKDQDAVVAIDRVRLSQIITNGMRYWQLRCQIEAAFHSQYVLVIVRCLMAQ